MAWIVGCLFRQGCSPFLTSIPIPKPKQRKIMFSALYEQRQRPQQYGRRMFFCAPTMRLPAFNRCSSDTNLYCVLCSPHEAVFFSYSSTSSTTTNQCPWRFSNPVSIRRTSSMVTKLRRNSIGATLPRSCLFRSHITWWPEL